MSKKNQPAKSVKKEELKKKAAPVGKDLFTNIESWLDARKTIWGIGTVVLSLLLSLLMFNAKISIGHDDALYIEAANSYAKNFFTYFYTANAPLYMIFLALPIKIWGVNVIVLKLFSVLFFVAGTYFLYRAYVNRIPHLILFVTLLLFSANWMALEYASLTYTEAMYLMLQALFLWVLNVISGKVMESPDATVSELIKKHLGLWIGLGVMFYMLYFTRTVGLGALVVFPLVMLVFRRFKPLIIGTASMLIFTGIFEVLKRIVWSGAPTVSSNQSDILFQKDPYDASQGTEDLAGFVDRFWGNIQVYLSSRFWEVLGFREEPSEAIASLAILTIIPLIAGLLMSIPKKQFAVLNTALYTGALLFITFVVLQVQWGQGRLVMVFVPMMSIVGMYFFYTLFKSENLKGFQFVFLLMSAVFLFTGFKTTLGKIKTNIPVAKANLIKGDKFAGYTDDWKNYLKLSEWCADSLPPNSLVACRKAPMSFVYGKGKQFYAIYRGDETANADSIVAQLKRDKVTHVILANLRVNPKSSQQGIINTVHRFLKPIVDKYPESLEFVRQEGTSEESVLYKFNFK